jgi:hypothetical protein
MSKACPSLTGWPYPHASLVEKKFLFPLTISRVLRSLPRQHIYKTTGEIRHSPIEQAKRVGESTMGSMPFPLDAQPLTREKDG